MIKGLYTSAAAMMTNRRRLNIVSNNLANADTNGYKKDRTIQQAFPEMLMKRLENGKEEKVIGKLGTGVSIEETYTDHGQGKLRQTGDKLDLALKGKGYFVVQTPSGEAYTRNGDFTLNTEGQVVTQQGYPVLDENGRPLQTIPGRSIQIDGNGQLFLGDQPGARIQIVDFPEGNQLEKMGENLYQASGELAPVQAEDYQLHQGYLEQSNVNIVREMVNMIEANRQYQVNQRVIQKADSTLDKAVNQVGRVG